MSDEIKIDSNSDKINRLLNNVANKSEENIKRDLKFWGLEAVNDIKTGRFSGSTTDKTLTSRTGQLRAKMDFDVETVAELIDGSFTNNLIYAAIHEFGGTIKPKKGTYLSIPLDHVKTAGGVARGGPRDYPNLKFFDRGKGNPLLMDTTGNQFIPAFVLVKFVKIKPRLGIRATIKANQSALVGVLGASFINA